MLGAGYAYAVFGKFAVAVAESTTSDAYALSSLVRGLNQEEPGNRYSEKLLAGSDRLLVKSIK